MARWIFTMVSLGVFLLFGCAAEPISHISSNPALLNAAKIRRVTVLTFQSPPDDPQAGTHISSLFESFLLQSGLYEIVERERVENFLHRKGWDKSLAMDRETIRQVEEQFGVEGIILGEVSQYNRANLGFTARLVSVKSGLVLWSISQTGGQLIRPLSQVAEETVEQAVKELQAKIR
jgi:TolB-like protein